MTLFIALTASPEFDAVADVSAVGFQHANLIMDTSYPSGGYPVTPSRFGFVGRIIDVVTTALASKKNNYTAQFDAVKSTVRVFTIPAGVGAWTEVTATTNLGGVVIRTIAIGY